MKKLILAIVFVLVLTVTACGNGETDASLPDGFTEVEQDEFTGGEVTVVRHNVTGCYYTFMDGSYSGAFTQMFVEKNGVSVPYCN